MALMFAILSRCDSIAEIIDGMVGLSGKLQYLNMEKVSAKRTFSDGIRKRSDKPGLCIRKSLPALRYGEAGIPKLNFVPLARQGLQIRIRRGGLFCFCNRSGDTLFEYK